MRTLPVIAIATVLTASVQADMIDTSGMAPWETCALCHSLDGISRMSKFPKLAGQPASYIEKQLLDFKAGRRENDGGQMEAIAADVTDENRPKVAAYFAGLTPPPPVPLESVDPAVETVIERGFGETVPACMSCHGKDRVADSGAPRLESQHADYIAKQLRDFKEGARSNDSGAIMRKIAGALPNELIDRIAAHLAARERLK